MAKHIDADVEAKEYLDKQLEKAETERIPDLLTLLLTVAIVGAFAIALWIIPDRTFSEDENRELASFPEFNVNSLVSGEFTSDFATYLADQFPLRDEFVGLKALSEVAMAKFENNGVMINGDVLAERFDSVNADNLTKNTDAIGQFTDAAEKSGIKSAFCVMGRTIDNYTFPLYDKSVLNESWELLSQTNATLIRSLTGKHPNEYVYYRTDHHYTTLGAYYTYAELANVIGYEANSIDHYNIECASDKFYGTTYSKAGAKWVSPDTIEYFRWNGDENIKVTVEETGEVHDGMYFTEYLDTKDKYASFLGGNYARVDIIGEGEGREKLLLIKDSFGHSLAPFLAEHYDIIMIDPRYYKKPIIKLAEEENVSSVLVICNLDTLSSATPFATLRMGIK